MCDTGADVSLISLKTLKSLKLEKKIRKSSLRLTTYTGDQIKVIGSVTIPITYGRNSENVSFQVVESGTNILGERDCVKVGMIKWLSGFEKLEIKEVVRNDDRVREEIVKDKGINNKAIIYKNYFTSYQFDSQLKQGFRPHISRERFLPYQIQSVVKDEILKLVDEGILQHTEHTDWCSPIVVVKKKEGSLRICGDFRELNKALREDKCPYLIFKIY